VVRREVRADEEGEEGAGRKRKGISFSDVERGVIEWEKR